MQTRWGFLNPEREGNTQRKTGRLYWAYARVWLGYLGTCCKGKEVQGRGFYRVKVVCRGTQGRGHFWFGMSECVGGEVQRGTESRVTGQR